ncbi:MAG TPA: pantoate--beta-alanine ligase [Planctomycetota bacterium]|nr:pantoate--beta-alanine ligase [Planctomycetota bacterium]
MALQVVKTPADMLKLSKQWTRDGKSIGFVPTMGALHAGHVSLIERARKENDAVAVSIYVNPTQFGPGEDFSKYPRTFDEDRKLCEAAGADAIFAPDTLYGKDPRIFVDVGELGDVLCGMSRPGHFRGVATVVTKLLSIVRPDRAYFGKKDAQQLLVIEQLVKDLDLGCEIVPCPIVREPDGLAMSSRNRYLSPSERKQALCLQKALKYCETKVAAGERDAMKLMGEMAEILQKEPDVEMDYIALVDAHTLVDLKRLRGNVLVAIAAKVGSTRLIDNTSFKNLS